MAHATGGLPAAAGLLLASLTGLASPGLAQQAGWYAAAQAEAGHPLFNNYCAECHRPDLTGAQGPALKGPGFLQRWTGQPLSALYGFEHQTMPATEPGSLGDDKLLPITAYILQRNGYAAGDAALDQSTLARTLPMP